ncbi:MAG: hypothetical protein WA361_09760, partial [Candidatus Acidiferrales bacterium]
ISLRAAAKLPVDALIAVLALAFIGIVRCSGDGPNVKVITAVRGVASWGACGTRGVEGPNLEARIEALELSLSSNCIHG